MSDHDDIPNEWPDARPWIRGKLSDLDAGVRSVDNRVTAQGEAHAVEMTILRQLMQKLSSDREVDIRRQGRFHDELKGEFKSESMRADIRLIVWLIPALAMIAMFSYWLATK
jgi:hypothetical protein